MPEIALTLSGLNGILAKKHAQEEKIMGKNIRQ